MASRSSFSVTGQSAASGRVTSRAMRALEAKVRRKFMTDDLRAGLYGNDFRRRAVTMRASADAMILPCARFFSLLIVTAVVPACVGSPGPAPPPPAPPTLG